MSELIVEQLTVPEFMRRTGVTDDVLDELLRLAGIPATEDIFRKVLIDSLFLARMFVREWKKVPRPAEENEVIAAVETAARRLLEALVSLDPRKYWAVKNRFWRAAVREGLQPEEDVKAIVERIVASAAHAKVNPFSRPNESKKGIVDTALDFFLQHSPFAVSGTGTGKFAAFARQFYSAVTGVDPDGDGDGIDRQIRTVVRERRNTTLSKNRLGAS